MRKKIFQLINAISAKDCLEQEHKRFALGWVQSGANLFRIKKPSTPPIHLVSYFVPFDFKTHKILLVDHIKAKLWLPPGGHVEINEHPKDTVKREIQEELFIKAEFFKEIPIFISLAKTQNNLHCHMDVSLWYVVAADSNKKLNFCTKEFHKISWFSLESVPLKESEPHISRFLAKLISINNGEKSLF